MTNVTFEESHFGGPYFKVVLDPDNLLWSQGYKWNDFKDKVDKFFNDNSDKDD